MQTQTHENTYEVLPSSRVTLCSTKVRDTESKVVTFYPYYRHRGTLPGTLLLNATAPTPRTEARTVAPPRYTNDTSHSRRQRI